MFVDDCEVSIFKIGATPSRRPFARACACELHMKSAFIEDRTEAGDTIFFHEFRVDVFEASYCDPCANLETPLIKVTPIPFGDDESSFLERFSIQFNLGIMEEDIADAVKKWCCIFCVGTLDIILEQSRLEVMMNYLNDITNLFQCSFLTWWMALPLHKNIFSVDGLNELRGTHPLSCRAHAVTEQTIRGAVRQFEILSGAGKTALISHWELNVVTSGFQIHHLQRFRINTVGTRKRPPHILLLDGVLPPMHIIISKNAGQDPNFKVDLRGFGTRRVVTRNFHSKKSFPSLFDAMTPVLDNWSINMRTFGNITAGELRDKLLQAHTDMTAAVQSATALFQLVNESFADLLEVLDEPLTREEMCCTDRYFDIVVLGEVTFASHFIHLVDL